MDRRPTLVQRRRGDLRWILWGRLPERSGGPETASPEDHVRLRGHLQLHRGRSGPRGCIRLAAQHGLRVPPGAVGQGGPIRGPGCGRGNPHPGGPEPRQRATGELAHGGAPQVHLAVVLDALLCPLVRGLESASHLRRLLEAERLQLRGATLPIPGHPHLLHRRLVRHLQTGDLEELSGPDRPPGLRPPPGWPLDPLHGADVRRGRRLRAGGEDDAPEEGGEVVRPVPQGKGPGPGAAASGPVLRHGRRIGETQRQGEAPERRRLEELRYLAPRGVAATTPVSAPRRQPSPRVASGTAV